MYLKMLEISAIQSQAFDSHTIVFRTDQHLSQYQNCEVYIIELMHMCVY